MVTLSLDKLKTISEGKVKTAFYASDVGKSNYDLYHGFIGTPKTNPIKWFEMLRMGAGNGVEAAMLQVLKDSGFVDKDYDQNIHGLVSYKCGDIEIHGRMDAVTKDGYPIEIKSINNKNNWDISAYRDGYPRENYVGQLAVYMDFMKVNKGYLFVASMDGLETFLFECTRDGNIFTCGNVKFNIADEYTRWTQLYTDHVLTNIPPNPMEYRYKIPIEEIEWSKISKSKITSARNNRAVIGDFQVQYSPWKDKWIKEQGSTLGYTAEELIKINELTKGYSTW